MENLEQYIKPELLVLVAVLYFLGLMIKQSYTIDDKYIPLILGGAGIALSLLYIVSIEGIALIGIFTAITQGILVAGAAVYVNQLFKQKDK